MNTVRRVGIAIPFAAAVLGTSAPSFAQQPPQLVVVNVDLRNAKILNNIANHLNVNISNVPITVQVPVDVAANVCDVTVDVLSIAYKRGGASCYAQGSSAALNQMVQAVMNLQH
jgi:hypothetical protein